MERWCVSRGGAGDAGPVQLGSCSLLSLDRAPVTTCYDSILHPAREHQFTSFIETPLRSPNTEFYTRLALRFQLFANKVLYTIDRNNCPCPEYLTEVVKLTLTLKLKKGALYNKLSDFKTEQIYQFFDAWLSQLERRYRACAVTYFVSVVTVSFTLYY